MSMLRARVQRRPISDGELKFSVSDVQVIGRARTTQGGVGRWNDTGQHHVFPRRPGVNDCITSAQFCL